jgi:hypothetical protein
MASSWLGDMPALGPNRGDMEACNPPVPSSPLLPRGNAHQRAEDDLPAVAQKAVGDMDE